MIIKKFYKGMFVFNLRSESLNERIFHYNLNHFFLIYAFEKKIKIMKILNIE